MSAETYDQRIIPHDQFVAEMARDRRKRYAKGVAALIITLATIVFLAFSVTQLAGGAEVFTN